MLLNLFLYSYVLIIINGTLINKISPENDFLITKRVNGDNYETINENTIDNFMKKHSDGKLQRRKCRRSSKSSIDEEEHLRNVQELTNEVGKLSKLVQVLRDQQYLLSLLNDVNNFDNKGRNIEELPELQNEINRLKMSINETMKRNQNIGEVEEKLQKQMAQEKMEIESLKEVLSQITDVRNQMANNLDPTKVIDKKQRQLNQVDNRNVNKQIYKEGNAIQRQTTSKEDHELDKQLEMFANLEKQMSEIRKVVMDKKREKDDVPLRSTFDDVMLRSPLLSTTTKPLTIDQKLEKLISNISHPLKAHSIRAKTIARQRNAQDLSQFDDTRILNNRLSGENHFQQRDSSSLKKLLKSIDDDDESDDDIDDIMDKFKKQMTKRKRKQQNDDRIRSLLKSLDKNDFDNSMESKSEDANRDMLKLMTKILDRNKMPQSKNLNDLGDDDLNNEIKLLQKAIDELQPKDDLDLDIDDRNGDINIEKLLSLRGLRKPIKNFDKINLLKGQLAQLQNKHNGYHFNTYGMPPNLYPGNKPYYPSSYLNKNYPYGGGPSYGSHGNIAYTNPYNGAIPPRSIGSNVYSANYGGNNPYSGSIPYGTNSAYASGNSYGGSNSYGNPSGGSGNLYGSNSNPYGGNSNPYGSSTSYANGVPYGTSNSYGSPYGVNNPYVSPNIYGGNPTGSTSSGPAYASPNPYGPLNSYVPKSLQYNDQSKLPSYTPLSKYVYSNDLSHVTADDKIKNVPYPIYGKTQLNPYGSNFFPITNQQQAGYHENNRDNNKGNTNIVQGNQQEPYDHQTQTINIGQDYTQQKVEDLRNQINSLQGVINNLNRPEYTQKPEEKQMVYNLDAKIGELKNVINHLNEKNYGMESQGYMQNTHLNDYHDRSPNINVPNDGSNVPGNYQEPNANTYKAMPKTHADEVPQQFEEHQAIRPQMDNVRFQDDVNLHAEEQDDINNVEMQKSRVSRSLDNVVNDDDDEVADESLHHLATLLENSITNTKESTVEKTKLNDKLDELKEQLGMIFIGKSRLI